MTLARTALLVAAVAGLAFVAFWSARDAFRPPVDEDLDGGESEPTVELARGERYARVGSLTRDVYESFTGKIGATSRKEVRAPQGMRAPVVEIVKDEGDFVKKGDVLVRFSKEAILRDIEKARQDGRDDLVKIGQSWLEHVEIRAEQDGQVVDVYTELGRVPVDVGIPLMYIADRTAFSLRVQVPSGLTKTVAHLGARLKVDLAANLGQTEGTVSGFEDAPEGWIVLLVALDPKEGYEQDLDATVRVPASKAEVALVPKSAVTTREGVKIVRVYEPGDGPRGAGGSIGERTILTDGEQGDDWIVTAGVLPGESVVVPDEATRR